MNLKEFWAAADLNESNEVQIPFHVSKIESYLADAVNCRIWKQKLSRKGIKRDYVFLHDLILYDENGFQIRVLLHPLNNSVQDGRLLEGSVILATAITKSKVPIDNLDQFYLTLNNWVPHPDPGKVPIKFQRTFPLPKYVPEGRLLGNLTGKPLCPWTFSSLQVSSEVHIRRYCSVRRVPVSIKQAFDSNVHNLKNLESNWTNLRSPWPLALRVFAKSKDRMIIRQEDARKPILQLTTILVGDRSGFCKVVVWDDAVHSFSGLLEGDILVLGGKYKIGKYHSGQHNKYFLEPKLRSGLGPVSIELKLNLWDLDNVCILDHAADLPLPPPLWNFHAVQSLLRKPPKGNRLLDIVGVVIYHGRWERERCMNETSGFTGQFWIRVWLKLIDHTCLSEEGGGGSDSGVGIRMFISGERWEAMEALIPGCPCVITNLIYQKAGDKFNYLECSNETQIFCGDAAFSSRFIVPLTPPENPELVASNNVVKDFRESWNTDTEAWMEYLRKHVCYGGHLMPCSSISFQQRIEGFVLRDLSDLKQLFQTLPFKVGTRVLVAGCMLAVRTISIDDSGSGIVTEEIILEYAESSNAGSQPGEPGISFEELDTSRLQAEDLGPSGVLLDSTEAVETFCTPLPNKTSLLRICGETVDLRKAVNETCFMHQNDQKESDQNQNNFQKTSVCMVLLGIRNCRLWCIADIEIKTQLMEMDELNSRFCIDFFRFAGYQGTDFSTGTDAVLRKVLLNSHQENAEASEVEPDPDNSSLLGDQTLDFLQPFSSI